MTANSSNGRHKALNEIQGMRPPKTQESMSDDNENSRESSLNSDGVTEEPTSYSITETEGLEGTSSQKQYPSSSFRLGKTLLGLGIFALLTGNILVLTNHFKPSSSMAGMEGMDRGDMSHDEMMAVDGSFNHNPVRVETFKPQVLEASVSYTGTIKPYEEIMVYPRVAGQVTNYSVYPGDRVTAGQPIATLDASELTTGVAEAIAEADTMKSALEMSKIEVDEQKSAIAQIEADLDYLNLKKDRFARLVKDGVISQDEFDVVDSEVRSKEANLKQARVKLARMEAQVTNNRAKINQAKAKVDTAKVIQGYTTITSPISGIVQKRNVDPGVVVQPSMMGIVKIGNYNRVRLQANVAQSDAVNIRPGATVVATVPGSNIPPIKDKITSIFPQANSKTRTVTVEAVIDNPDGQLLSGKFLEMKIVTARKANAITVPQAAVVEFQDQSSVWVVEGDTVTAQPVTLGMSTGDRIEALGGLESGQVVVTSGQHRLVENATVAIINQSEQAIASSKASSQNIQIQLISPDNRQLTMGDAQLILEVKNAGGQPIEVKNLEVSASMPMKNMAPMTAKVEVQPTDKSGRFQVDTYLSMKGEWVITAQVKDPQHKGKQEFTFEVR